ncbi:hypothetical protein OR1_03055 [Geobacter sp. OR-1]|uniref:hypothetical protein n=1 Tax=Geobacter sp. OR-1 TaxID=1266765 RepID=UPI000543111B|nr:hypothetical protein [Geobacter sp. OR-1]GAM10758.1 hypothetical protein OR1_03055 [Geobacter sp. OR-1]
MDADESSQQYLCGSWQGFIQQIVYQFGRGYEHFCLTVLPDEKRDKWLMIDNKLISKYGCNRSKYQRYRSKAKGEANYVYLRWQHLALLLRTKGTLKPESDRFCDIHEHDLRIPISSLVTMKIHKRRKETTTVFLSKDTIKGMKAEFADIIGKDHFDKSFITKRVLTIWDYTNGFPQYSGLIEQRSQILDFVVKKCRKHNIPLKREDFRFNTKRKIYKVWLESPDTIPEDA